MIPATAITKKGFFTTHRVGDRLLYEIPTNLLDRDMLLVGRITKTSLGFGVAGQELGNRVIRWSRRGNRVVLSSRSYSVTADTSLPIAIGVAAASYDPVVASYNIESFGVDSAPVIDVTRLFTAEVPEWGVRRQMRLGAGGALDANRTYIDRVATYPENIEVEAVQTFSGGTAAPGAPVPGGPPPPSQTAVAHFSMVKLPDVPMRPRLWDSRVGLFDRQILDFGFPAQHVTPRRFITRYRLEKKDPNAAVSEPIKPIVYYIDPATPKQFVPYVKKGIEDWNGPFETAGFKNAIIAKEAPSKAEDPDWSPDDARYSIVRWYVTTVSNGYGPHIHDPRSGEILQSSVEMYHNLTQHIRQWAFIQAGPSEPRARQIPLPDSLLGLAIQVYTSHEIGHSIGLRHNMKGTSSYPVDSLRSRSFAKRMGVTPSVMDYVRFNYVAQPEDRIPFEDLIYRIGPYDHFAVSWAYKPIPGARTPEDELPTLDKWAGVQDTMPWLRYGETNNADGTVNTEIAGDADIGRASEYGVRNLKRLIPTIQAATTKPGADTTLLAEMYRATIGQWQQEVGTVAGMLGRPMAQDKHGSQPGAIWRPRPREYEQSMVRFLHENAFATPTWLLDTTIIRRIEASGTVAQVGNAQRGILNNLLQTARMARMLEVEALARSPRDVYTVHELLSDVRRGLWSELQAPRVTVDALRRNLQRSHVVALVDKLRPTPPPPGAFGATPPPGDLQALARGELRDIARAAAAALPKAGNDMTRRHLEDIQALVDEGLKKKD